MKSIGMTGAWVIGLAVLVVLPAAVRATGNIDPVNKYACSAPRANPLTPPRQWGILTFEQTPSNMKGI